MPRILIITAHRKMDQLDVVFEAMNAGALDVIDKPDSGNQDQFQRWTNILHEKVSALSDFQYQ